MKYGMVQLVHCIRHGNGIIFVGKVLNVIEFLSKQKPNGVSEEFGWLIAIDQSGAIQWEKIIDFPGRHSIRDLQLVSLGAEGMVLAEQFSDKEETILQKLDTQGNPLKQKTIKGCPLVVRSASQDSIVEVVWFNGAAPEISTYDKDLREIRVTTGKNWPASEFYITNVHRLIDGSYAFIGSDHYRPIAAFMKDAVTPITLINIGDNTDKECVPFVWAAAPTGKPGEIVVAPDVDSRHILFVEAPAAWGLSPTATAQPPAAPPVLVPAK